MVEAVMVGARALVKPLEASEATATGLILPQITRTQQRRGLVVAVGSWLNEMGQPDEDIEPPVEVGDVVVWPETSGMDVHLDTAEDGKAEHYVVLFFHEIALKLIETPVAA